MTTHNLKNETTIPDSIIAILSCSGEKLDEKEMGNLYTDYALFKEFVHEQIIARTVKKKRNEGRKCHK
jgi:hypothetical protein